MNKTEMTPATKEPSETDRHKDLSKLIFLIQTLKKERNQTPLCMTYLEMGKHLVLVSLSKL